MIGFFVYKLDSYSGAAQQALLLAKELSKSVIIFNHNNSRYKKYYINENILVIDIPNNNILKLLTVIYITLTKRVKVYHLHGFFKHGLLLGAVLRKKIILKTTLLGSDDFDTLSKTKGWSLKKKLINYIETNAVLSKKAREINSKYIPSSKIKLIPNGVKLQANLNSFEDRKQNFCYVGLVCERKRTYESIKYFADVFSDLPEAKMLIVGPYNGVKNNIEFDESYVKKCFDLIKSKKIQDKVVFTGLISKEETQKILNKSKALLFFSSKEGLPNVVLEAMSNNCVPLVSELDGVSAEIFDDGRHGFILKDDRTRVDIEKIDKILKARAPFELMKKKFAISIIANIYDNLYEN